MGHHRGFVVKRHVVVRVLPAGRRRWRATATINSGVVGHGCDQSLAHVRVVHQQFARVTDQLDVVSIHEGQERKERVAGINAHGLANAKAALTCFLSVCRLDLATPKFPVIFPVGGNICVLEARIAQHVSPVLDVHGLLLDGEGVISAFVFFVVEQKGGFNGVASETRTDRVDHAADVLELAIVGPRSRHLKVVHVSIGHIGWGARVQSRNGLWNHVLNRILRQLDLDIFVLGFEFFDGRIKRVIFSLVKAFDPKNIQFFL